MRNILLLFIRNGGFVTFLLLEVLCFYLIVAYNAQQNAIFTYNAGQVGGAISKRTHALTQYFNLAERSDSIAAQNAALQTQLYNLQAESAVLKDTIFIKENDSLQQFTARPQYAFIAAQVLSNSIDQKSNWLLINRGSDDGVTPDMGVSSGNGIIGIVRHVSKNFAMVMSVLHPQTKISASLQYSGYFGSLVWEGSDPGYMVLRDIPKHAVVKEGEQVFTNGYSLFFPKGILIGYTGKPSLKDGSNFYTIPVRLSQELSRTSDVYVIKNIFYSEIKALEEKAHHE